MQLIIGRDKATSKLAITVDSKTYTWGTAGMVPGSVSRQHCRLTIEGGATIITNLKQENFTWVNGTAVENCKVKLGSDNVELGIDRFRLDWNAVNEVLKIIEKQNPKEIDLSHLKSVWENYQLSLGKMQSRQAFVNACRGGVPLLTIGGVAAAYFVGDKSSGMMPVLYVIAAVVMALFFIIGIIDAIKTPKKKEQITKDFTHKYVCPNCGYFFGYQSYDILKNNLDNCPKCHAKVKKQ